MLMALLLALGVSGCIAFPDPSKAVAPIMYNGSPVCTAWHYSPHIYITASHCTTNPDQEYMLTVDLLPRTGLVHGTVVKIDVEADIAAIFVLGQGGEPILQLSAHPSMVGESVRGLGYGGRSNTAYYTYGHISSLLMVFPTARTGENLILYGGFIPGMSGGPILNNWGEVISVIVGSGPPHGIFHNIGVGTAPGMLEQFVDNLP